MSQSEDLEIDRALIVCQLMNNGLLESLKTVQRMSNKYNAPGRYTIDVRPFDVDSALVAAETASIASTVDSLSLSNVSDFSVDDTSVTSLNLSSAGGRLRGRSRRELDDTYVDLKWKCIKMRRDLEATTAHAQRLALLSKQQKRVKHHMLAKSSSLKKTTCTH